MSGEIDRYIFRGEVAPKYRSPGSVPQWTQSTDVVVIASHRDEAFRMMKSVMGTPPQDVVWVPRITSIEPLLLGGLKYVPS